jgi:hypothetical protein
MCHVKELAGATCLNIGNTPGGQISIKTINQAMSFDDFHAVLENLDQPPKSGCLLPLPDNSFSPTHQNAESIQAYVLQKE